MFSANSPEGDQYRPYGPGTRDSGFGIPDSGSGSGFGDRFADTPAWQNIPRWRFRLRQPKKSNAVEARRVALAGGIGTTIEWADFFIYGAAAVVFAPQFFPQVSDLAGTLAAFGTFAIGFIARPLGGVAMGHYGDRLGRKSMLVWSLMLMGLSTLGIGLLPNYAQLGVWAPILLVPSVRAGVRARRRVGGCRAHVGRARTAGARGFFGSFVALGLPAGSSCPISCFS